MCKLCPVLYIQNQKSHGPLSHYIKDTINYLKKFYVSCSWIYCMSVINTLCNYIAMTCGSVV